jgi:Zn-dependent protease with chaperone function
MTALALIGLAAVELGLWLIDPSRASPWCVLGLRPAWDAFLHSASLGGMVLAALVVLVVVRAWRHQRGVAAELRWAMTHGRAPELPPRLAHVAHESDTHRWVDAVEATAPFAFVHGWLRPRICVSTGLVARLDDRELAAVLHHENWHRIRRDPARLVVVRTAMAPVAALPLATRCLDRLALVAEIEADRYAVVRTGHPRWVASALLKVTGTPGRATAFGDLAEARVAALLGEPVPAGLPRRQALLVAMVAPLLVAVAGGGFPIVLGLLHPLC